MLYDFTDITTGKTIINERQLIAWSQGIFYTKFTSKGEKRDSGAADVW